MPKPFRLLGLIFLLSFNVSMSQSQSDFSMQRGDEISSFQGEIESALDDEILIYVNDLQEGDTLYVIAESDEFDTYLLILRDDLRESLAEDNNGAGATNATITYEIEEDGDYVVGMFSVRGIGEYTITVGINDPRALIGASDNGHEEEYSLTSIGEVREFTGTFDDDDEEVIISIPDVEAGDTIYVYAAGSGSVDTYVYVMDGRQRRVFAEDDDGGGGFNSALSYEAEESGDFTIGLITVGSVGDYRLLVGINTPELLEVQDSAAAAPTEFEPFDCDEAELGDRPNISGSDRSYEADAFVIHYSLSGRDETTEEWVEVLAEAIQRSLDVQINDLGWALPPADCGEGGDSRLDIYVLDLENSPAIGIARPENVVGDNPNTDVVEFYAAYSYLIIENDLEYIDDEEVAFNILRTVAAHEVHHNIQFGYDVNDRFFGFYEAGATWVETLVYPDIAEVGSEVNPLFNEPDLCIGSFAGREVNDLRIYAEWLVIDSFTRDLGLESYQFIWEFMSTGEGLLGFYTALGELGSSPEEVVLRMAVRNLLYDYELSKYFTTTVRIEATVNGVGFVTPRRTGVQQLSVDYVRLTEMDTYTINLIDGDNMELYAVGINRNDDTARVYELGQGGTIDFSPYSHAYIIVLNSQRHASSNACEYADWILQVLDGEGEELLEPTDEVWNAAEFEVAR